MFAQCQQFHIQWYHGGKQPIGLLSRDVGTSLRHAGLNFHSQDFSSLLHRLSQIVKYLHGIRPVDAGICNTDAVLEPGFALLRYLLVAYSPILVKFRRWKAFFNNPPSSMLLSIISPMMAVSPLATCSATTLATLGWFLWFFRELP